MYLVMEFWKTSYKNIYDIEICDFFPTQREIDSMFWFVFFPLYMYTCVGSVLKYTLIISKQNKNSFFKKGLV